uniref:Putative coat protein n=1 Tax=Blechomonas juanalfonzi Leishmaniavirus-like RNA virus 1 TaxID=2364203 RepID=A0A386ISA9_9VIRU|nr:putative coat protein [Blechomonas juanalfonzi Leishmaniavirus-like RNA virus 1]
MSGNALLVEVGRETAYSDTVNQLVDDSFSRMKGRCAIGGGGERVYATSILSKSQGPQGLQANLRVFHRLKLRTSSLEEVDYLKGFEGVCGRYPQTQHSMLSSLFSRHSEVRITESFEAQVDFSSMLYHAGRCLMWYSMTQKCGYEEVTNSKKGGRDDCAISCIGNLPGAVALTGQALYLPDRIREKSPLLYDTLLMLGVAAEANIVLGTVVLNQGTLRMAVTQRPPEDVACGLHLAVEYLLALSSLCGVGTAAALALTCGLHSIATVVGHTDEGGLMRDVLRADVPRGCYGIIGDVELIQTGCLPRLLGVTSWNMLSGIWDKITLATAGLVAVSDPLMRIGAKFYPTIVSTQAPSVYERVVAYFRSSNDFAGLYLKNLTTYFGVTHDENTAGSLYLTYLFNSSIENKGGISDRHASAQVIAPWFWIEPTGVFKNTTWMESPANDLGYGVLAIPRVPTTVGSCDDVLSIASRGPDTVVTLDWTTARRNTLLNILLRKRDDGLGRIRVVPEAGDWILDGQPRRRDCTVTNHGTESATCGHKNPNLGTIDEYLWGRTSSDLFAPAELTSLQPVLLSIQNWYQAGAEWECFSDDIPAALLHPVENIVTNTCLLPGRSNLTFFTEVRREFTKSALFLRSVRTKLWNEQEQCAVSMTNSTLARAEERRRVRLEEARAAAVEAAHARRLPEVPVGPHAEVKVHVQPLHIPGQQWRTIYHQPQTVMTQRRESVSLPPTTSVGAVESTAVQDQLSGTETVVIEGGS